ANPALRAAADETEQLARRLGWCGAVAVRDGGEARVVDVFDFGPPFGPRAKVGQTIELVPPFGAVFVAWHGDDVDAWLAYAEDRSARTQYRTSLETIRQRGYSITLATQRNPELAQALETLTERPNATDARRRRDELIQQMMHASTLATELADDTAARISQISAPVFDAAGGATTSIMLVGPDYDITGAEAAQLGRGIADAAARATERGGGRRPETW
ncbi:MAG: hypothetical protein KDB21_18875, partial [Acidimicrobiales bacterium]|nr:hypothetical protein [Acidimicrobiales bacterium]